MALTSTPVTSIDATVVAGSSSVDKFVGGANRLKYVLIVCVTLRGTNTP